MTADEHSAHTLFATAIGHCGIAWRGDTVIATTLPEASEALTSERISRRAKSAGETTPPARIAAAIADITSLIAGHRTDLTHIACDLGPDDDFNARVYRVTRTIPAGQTLTYGEVADRLGNKTWAQAVGHALGRNHLPIIVPCHRVLGAGGKLTGFSADGGVVTKLRLLEIEGAEVAAPTSLFDALPLATKPAARSRDKTIGRK